MNSLCTVSAAWLNASQRSSVLNVPMDWIPRYIKMYLQPVQYQKGDCFLASRNFCLKQNSMAITEW